MKKILTLFLLSICFIQANEPECPEEPVDGFRYATIGVGPIIFIPNIGIGYRERYGQYGLDGAFSFSTIGYAHQLSAHAVGHYYLEPEKLDSTYLGLGVMGSCILTNHGKGGFTLSPDFVVGKELNRGSDRRQFVELHVAIPTLWMESKRTRGMYLPLMYLKYGFSF